MLPRGPFERMVCGLRPRQRTTLACWNCWQWNLALDLSLLTVLTKPSNRPPRICQSHQESLSQSNSRPNAHIQPQGISTGMHNTREGLFKRNIPRYITNVIMRSLREGTQKQYSVYLRKWDEFCVQRQINSVQTSVYEVSWMIGLLKVCPIRPSILHAQR